MNRDLINELLELAKREHYNCEDTWYGCPLSENGCSNDAWPQDQCNCGADEHNAKVDRIAAELKAS